jgi:hypothetical protein
MQFSFTIRTNTPSSGGGSGTTYTIGTGSNYGGIQGQALGTFNFTGGNIPNGTIGTVSFNGTNYSGSFNSSGQFIPSSSPVIPTNNPTGSQSFTLTTSGLSNNPVFNGNITINTGSGGGSGTNNTTLGSPIGTPITLTQGQSFPTINFTGGNVVAGTNAVMNIPTSSGNIAINGTINASGAFIPNSGLLIPANATTGSQLINITTTGLSSNVNVNVQFSVQVNTVPSVTQLNKSIIFGVNGNQYSVLDLTNNTIVGQSVETISSYTGGNYTKQIARNANGTTLYKTDQDFGVVKLSWNNTANILSYVNSRAIPSGSTLYGLDYSNTDDLIFTAHRDSSQKAVITIINASTMAIVSSTTLTNHQYSSGQIVFDEINKYLYVAGRRVGGEASILRATVNVNTGVLSNYVQWDFVGGGFTAWGLGLTDDGSKLIATVNGNSTLPTANKNVHILNTSQFSAGNTVYSFQGTPPPTTPSTYQLTALAGTSGDARNVYVAGNKFVIGAGSGVGITGFGDASGNSITDMPSIAYSETVGLNPTATKIVQLGYTANKAEIRDTTGLALAPAINVVTAPLAVINL